MSRKLVLALFAAVLGCASIAMSAGAGAAEVTLKAITSFPKAFFNNKPFFMFVDEVNEEGQGMVRIEYVSGPEATPVQEQMGALQRGVVDMYFGPTSYFDGQIPEVVAQNASNRSAMDLRKDGALALLNVAFNKKANAEYLGYFASSVPFHIYLKEASKRTASGGVDLKGMKIRGTTPYRGFFDMLGINMIVAHVPEMYTALERGIVEGMGWPNVAVTNFGWHKFVKYRIFPTFWQGDIAIVMNRGRWTGLSSEARAFLEKKVIKHEKLSYYFFKLAAAEEAIRFHEAGMKDVVLEGAEATKYLAAAHGSLWAALESKISKDEVAALRAKFYKE